MVLVNGIRDLPLPHPPSAELVTIPAFVHQHIAWLQSQLIRLLLRNSNSGDVSEFEMPTLDIRNAKVGNLGKIWVRLLLLVLRDPANNFS